MAAHFGNKYALGNKGGRPPMFETPEELSKEVDEYFLYIQGEYYEEEWKEKNKKTKKEEVFKRTVCDRAPEPATITGLALFLGFQNRQSLYDYKKEEEFSVIIKNGILRVEHEYEKNLYGNTPTGSIFALKNMGWRDKTETEHSGGIEVKNITGMSVT